ncbi:hypothetical protein P4O66_014308 [Electrophorus voltai]|uniref:EF-hand domain-containing protein n=1 Tax=Electrophorus voltai TaxID=2609070 RepID=A0AAD9DPI7_9TELE|nr:hypothetical protein P4O66_014308 [Electrophorus voltai]
MYQHVPPTPPLGVLFQKLHGEMPLTAEELENVFNSLDSDKNGCLTLEEFSLGFRDFLYGRKLSQAQDQMADLSQNVPEVLYQDEPQAGIEDEEEKHFSLLMERLDACSVFKELVYSEVRSLWAQLQKDEPHLLSNFEEFLAQVTSQIRQERKEMEDALRIKAATHDGEIRQLYEEMEQQINTEKDQLLLKGSERIQQWSQDLEQQLSCKEQELEQLGLRHRRLEKQCQELHSEHQESRVENNKLKMTNEELSHELENTCHELSLAQEQLAILEEQAVRLQQEREMEIYRITEGLQREKQSLIKQLDLLREINKHLRDERDISSMKKNILILVTEEEQLIQKNHPFTETSSNYPNKEFWEEPRYCKSLASPHPREMSTEEVTQPSSRKPSSLLNVRTSHLGARAEGKTRIADCTSNAGWAPATMSPGVDVTVAPPEGWPLRRVISIEEDHLPNLLQEDPHLLLHQLAEEEEKGGQEEAQTDLEMYSSDMFLACADSAPLARGKMHFSEQKGGEGTVPNLTRGQPVGKESLQKGPVEDAVGLRECIFKVIFVGNSSVGKTALLRRFCDGRFHPTMVTVGIDYCMHSLNLGDSLVRLQLWDTAGQERYRSITQQFFRKADGVVVIYDVTTHDSFSSVHCWLDSIEEEVRGPIPIMLLGNKSDKEIMREVPTKVGEQLAQTADQVMREQEDRVWESTVLLVDKPMKRKACCN